MSQWHRTKLKFLCREVDVRQGGEGELPLLSVSIHRGVLPRSEMSNLETRADDISDYKRVQPGDVVLNRMRAFQGAVGISRAGGLVTPEYMVLRATTAADAGFLNHLVKSAWFVSEMSSRLRGIGTAEQGNVRTPRIYWDALGAIDVMVPNLEEQRTIAHFLDRETARIDEVIGWRTMLLEHLAERRRAILFRGVTGLLAPAAEGHDPGLPWARLVRVPWPAVKIKHVARLGTGHTPSRTHPEYWEACTIPWITTGEIQQVRDDRAEVITETREKISELGLASSSAELCPAGAVVLCRTASAGYSAIMGSTMATSQDFSTWTCSDRLLPRYLLMCLRAMRSDLLGRLAFGSTHKTIYMPDIEALKIPLPTIEEQRQVLLTIDSKTAWIDALSNRLRDQLALLTERRRALISALVTGSDATRHRERQ